MSEKMKLYNHNALEGFGAGCLMDLRVRLAIEFLKHSPMYAPTVGLPGTLLDPRCLSPAEAAIHALGVATALLDVADERGLIEPLPEDGELSPELRAQAKRNASFQALQQIEGQRFMQNETSGISRVVPMAPGMKKPN